MVWLKVFFLLAVVAVLFQAPLHWAIRKLVGKRAVSPEPSGPFDGMGWLVRGTGDTPKTSTLFSSAVDNDDDVFLGSATAPSPYCPASEMNIPERYNY